MQFSYHSSVSDMRPCSATDGTDEAFPSGKGCSQRWRIHLEGKDDILADRVVVATGGLSFPAVGTDGTGHRIARRLGHTADKVYPALTPLTGPHPGSDTIAGVSLDVQASVHLAKGSKERKKNAQRRFSAARTGFLFTHRGALQQAVASV